jgi:hypothetical protein
MVIGATATSDRQILPTAAISKFYCIPPAQMLYHRLGRARRKLNLQ